MWMQNRAIRKSGNVCGAGEGKEERIATLEDALERIATFPSQAPVTLLKQGKSLLSQPHKAPRSETDLVYSSLLLLLDVTNQDTYDSKHYPESISSSEIWKYISTERNSVLEYDNTE